MLPVKKILCPTDFSEPSYEAVRVANELASHFSSRLYLLHVVSLRPILVGTGGMIPTGFDVDAYQRALETSAREQLQKVIAQYVSEELKTVRSLIVSGSAAAEEIIRIAREEQIDLIVIGTRGRTGLSHFVLGSVAERVVQMAACPVLTVRVRHSEEAEAS